MDPVTHAVIGRSLDYLRKPGATDSGRGLAAVLGALSPDVDAILMPLGFDRYLAVHEIGTHSAAGVLVCAALTAAVTRFIRRREYGVMYGAAVVGAASHVAADLSAGAAIRVGWPFIDARVANLGTFAMGDPAIIVVCTIAALLLWRQPARRRTWALALMVILAAGVAAKSWSRARALDAYQTTVADAEGSPLIVPVWGSFLTWRLFDRTDNAVRAWTVSAGDNGASLAFSIPRIAPVEPSARVAIAASQEWDTVRHLRRAHDFTFVTVAPHAEAGALRVLWSDVRYCETATRCAIHAGGEWSAAGLQRLVVHVGDWTQFR